MKTREIVFYVIVGILVSAMYLGYEDRGSSASNVSQQASASHVASDRPMGRELESAISTVNQFSKDTFVRMPLNHDWVFVPYGSSVDTACNVGSSDTEMKYCEADDNVYVGEQFMQVIYDVGGKTGFLIAVAHEYGHHIQKAGDIHDASDITHERQADCFAGSIAEYAYRHGLADDPLGPSSVATFNLDISTNHGTHDERFQSLTTGATQGVTSCINMSS
jgi:predicted metalloprotease